MSGPDYVGPRGPRCLDPDCDGARALRRAFPKGFPLDNPSVDDWSEALWREIKSFAPPDTGRFRDKVMSFLDGHPLTRDFMQYVKRSMALEVCNICLASPKLLRQMGQKGDDGHGDTPSSLPPAGSCPVVDKRNFATDALLPYLPDRLAAEAVSRALHAELKGLFVERAMLVMATNPFTFDLPLMERLAMVAACAQAFKELRAAEEKALLADIYWLLEGMLHSDRAMREAGKATDAGTVLGEDAREGIKLILAKLKKGEQSAGQEKQC